MKEQAHLFIAGMVQGVGFRQFVKRNAKKHNVTGWTRNLNDGRVEAVLQGEKKAVDEVIAACRKGPFLSEVSDVSITWEDMPEQFADFSIRETV